MTEPRGAGMGGGLLFIGVVLFLGYLAVKAVQGILSMIIGLAFLLFVVWFGAKLLNRR